MAEEGTKYCLAIADCPGTTQVSLLTYRILGKSTTFAESVAKTEQIGWMIPTTNLDVMWVSVIEDPLRALHTRQYQTEPNWR